MLAEPLELGGDLESELSGVAEYQDADLPRLGLQLLQDGKNEHSGLPHAGGALEW
jgi:hypothetical protein